VHLVGFHYKNLTWNLIYVPVVKIVLFTRHAGSSPCWYIQLQHFLNSQNAILMFPLYTHCSTLCFSIAIPQFSQLLDMHKNIPAEIVQIFLIFPPSLIYFQLRYLSYSFHLYNLTHCIIYVVPNQVLSPFLYSNI
jgi:hypothetical protein